MYLDEEFRQPMYEHIKKRLNVVLSHNIAQDEAFKNQLLILAYITYLYFLHLKCANLFTLKHLSVFVIP